MDRFRLNELIGSLQDFLSAKKGELSALATIRYYEESEAFFIQLRVIKYVRCGLCEWHGSILTFIGRF